MRILGWCRSQRIYAEKRHGSVYGTAGQPDIDIVVPVDYQAYPVLVKVEAKQRGKKPDPRQQSQIRRLRRAGVVVIAVTTLDEVVETVKMIRREV
jgi:hypothetical protein